MIIFVGDRPSKSMEPGANPFVGAKCRPRLNEWIDHMFPASAQHYFNYGGYLTLYKIVNQCDYTEIEFQLATNCIFIALGNNASKKLRFTPHFKLPHPSGRNRKLNDKKNIQDLLDACKSYIETELKKKSFSS